MGDASLMGHKELLQSVTELRTQLHEVSENSKKQLSAVAFPDWAWKDGEAASRILWADDRPDNNTYERQAFEALGIAFMTALSTNEALQHLEGDEEFAAIISNRGRKEGIQTPFFIYAGSNAPEHKDETARHGGQGSTNDPKELFEMVTRTLLKVL